SAGGTRATFSVQLSGRGEYSLTLQATDTEGHGVRAFTSMWATVAKGPRLPAGSAQPSGMWSDPTPSPHLDPPDWLGDAIFYHLHTRVWAPRPAEIPGHFRRVIEKLDYLADL